MKLSIVDVFVLNIAFADFVFTSCIGVTMPLSRGNLNNSAAARIIWTFFSLACGFPSLMLLVGLAFTRYRYIVKRHGTQMSEVTIRRGIACVWVCGICLATAFTASGLNHAGWSELYVRFDFSIPGSALTVFRQIFSLFCTFFPPIGVYWFHKKMMEEIKKDVIDSAMSRRIARMIYLMNSMYFFTLLPYGSSVFYSLVSGQEVPKAIDNVLYTMIITNFLASPVIYCSCQRRYRNAVLALPGFRNLCSLLGIEVDTSSATPVPTGSGTTPDSVGHARRGNSMMSLEAKITADSTSGAQEHPDKASSPVVT